MLIRQDCSPVTVAFDDGAVAEFFDQQIDADHRPEQFARIWIHSHPGTSANPSSVDEETFARVFGRSDWAVMAILARGGQTYARLQFHTGPGGSLRIPITVDWSHSFDATDWPAWEQNYVQNVRQQERFDVPWPTSLKGSSSISDLLQPLFDFEHEDFPETEL